MKLPHLLLGVSLPLFVLDQITKFWTIANFPPPNHEFFPPIEVIENFFYLTRIHNQGVAFGMGNGTTWAPIVFLFVPLCALSLIYHFWKKGIFKHPLATLALALLISGIFGNLTDRLVQGFLLTDFAHLSFLERLSKGYVVDFLLFKLPLYDKIVPSSEGWWPAFNIADSCISTAAVCLLISSFLEERANKKNPSPNA